MSQLILHGHYHTLNYGDLLMADLIASHLLKHYNIRPTIPWVHPAMRGHLIAQAGHGFRSCLAANAAIFGGGGYLQTPPRYRPTWLLPMLLPAAYWRTTRRKYIITGVGVGPRMSPRQAARIATLCRWADAITVRDDQSKDLLLQIGVPADHVQVTADWVLSMTPSDLPPQATDWASQTLGPRANGELRLGLHVQDGVKDAQLLQRIAHSVAQGLASRDHIRIWWFFDQPTSALATFRQVVGQHLPRSTVIPAVDHMRTAALIGQFDAVLTTKLHVGITAFVLGAAPCAYAKQPKVERFYQQIGRTDYCVGTDESSDRITQWMRQLADNPSAFTSLDSHRRDALRTLAQRNEEVIDRTLGQTLRGGDGS